MPATQDAFYMARAIALAKKGLYTTAPNPRVGCVLVLDWQKKLPISGKTIFRKGCYF